MMKQCELGARAIRYASLLCYVAELCNVMLKLLVRVIDSSLGERPGEPRRAYRIRINRKKGDCQFFENCTRESVSARSVGLIISEQEASLVFVESLNTPADDGHLISKEI